MHTRQRGITLSGFLLWSLLLIVVLLVGFRIGPAYFEYFSIQRQMRVIAQDPALKGASRSEIENAFMRRSTIEDIRAIEPRDLEITKDGDTVRISASYSVQVHLFGNLSACMDFTPSSAQ